jgi:NCAIR mutase (PurE)-related protein
VGNQQIDFILEQVQSGSLSILEAKEKLKTFDEIGFATLDLHREKRQGFPEVIYGEGKTTEQILAIFQSLIKTSDRVLATRVKKEKAESILNVLPELVYNETAQTLFWKNEAVPAVSYGGYVAVVCAGTSDLPVAEEAAVTLQAMGCDVRRITDVGVAGIHRLFHHIDTIREATVVIVAAGMEGALPSVIGGLISSPMIAIPTSVGYGTNFNGISALLSMLNSCSSGISVVNIDNGFGAGYQAALIHRLAGTVKQE